MPQFTIDPGAEDAISRLALPTPPAAAPEMLNTTFPAGAGASPHALPAMPQGQSYGDAVFNALMLGLSGMMSPGVREAFQKRLVSEPEQRRKKKAAEEIQGITSMISSVLRSGDPSSFGSMVTQLSKLKNLEPESIQHAQKMMLDMSKQQGDAENERKVAESLAQFGDPETKQVVSSVLAASPGMKMADVMGLLKSGLLGEQPKLQAVQGVGLVRMPGTGVFARSGPQEPSVVMPSPDARLKISDSERKSIREAGFDPAKFVFVDEIPAEISKKMAGVEGKANLTEEAVLAVRLGIDISKPLSKEDASKLDKVLSGRKMERVVAGRSLMPPPVEGIGKIDALREMNRALTIIKTVISRRPDLVGPISGLETTMDRLFRGGDRDAVALVSALNVVRDVDIQRRSGMQTSSQEISRAIGFTKGRLPIVTRPVKTFLEDLLVIDKTVNEGLALWEGAYGSTSIRRNIDKAQQQRGEGIEVPPSWQGK